MHHTRQIGGACLLWDKIDVGKIEPVGTRRRTSNSIIIEKKEKERLLGIINRKNIR